uniref:cell division protein ZapA n=1 Tax=Thaumasiovibrio occultus TaxID=1891184 RepID=UPI000B359B0B|nr:cell division protein ZapA [Thaumasiovibrio occultus]
MSMQAIDIKIMGKSLKVNCPSGQEQALVAAANEFDSRLQALAERSKITNTEQLLMFAALNICHELQDEKKARQGTDWELTNRLGQMEDKLNRSLRSVLPRN